MAEVGLVRFAKVAMRIAETAMPRYRTKFSKHTFAQPQLVAILCLMRYEDWTFREAEVRLAEHSDLREALRLRQVPDYTTLYRFLRRFDEGALERCLTEVVAQMSASTERRGKTTIAVDATGLASGAISTFFGRRLEEFGRKQSRRHWLKWLMAVDVPRRLILAQTAQQGPRNDCATLRPLVDTASQHVSVGLVLADAEFDSERNHQFIHTKLNAESIIPAKRGKADWTITGIRAQMRRQFPHERYRQRSIVESVISSAKRKLSDNPIPPSPPAGPGIQRLSPLGVTTPSRKHKDVNRANRFQNSTEVALSRPDASLTFSKRRLLSMTPLKTTVTLNEVKDRGVLEPVLVPSCTVSRTMQLTGRTSFRTQ